MMVGRVLLVVAALSAVPASAAPTLAPVWSDHAVVQRDKPIVVEGEGTPRAPLEVTLGQETVRTRVPADGRFSVTLPPRTASADPITLTVSDGSGVIHVSDIVVGDVWLCSGQSNMELPVTRSLDAAGQIAAAADDGLRLLAIPKETAPAPAATFATPVVWTKAAPDTVRDFSAACFYMAQKLRRDLAIPIGAIHASWGGSQARAWFTREAGAALYGAEEIALLDRSQSDMAGAIARFAPRWEDWWRRGSGGQEPWRDPAALSWMPVPEIAPWTRWSGTSLAQDPLGNVLLRRTIQLTERQAAGGGTLDIGVIDDLDMTWVNGHPVGNTHGWNNERHYPVPPSFLKAGANEVLVVASNSWGEGGFQSAPERLAFRLAGGDAIPLGEGWLYSIGALRDMPPRAPWDANAGIGVMHNKMIAPLGRFALEGVAWYQGESDVGIPGYGARLTQLFAGWRRQFGPLEVLVVQLPNFGPLADKPVESGWAVVREEQRKAVAADGDARLVASLDIGDPGDLHPPNKNELGRRLARAAEGEALPMPGEAARRNGAIRLTFTGIEDGLHSWSGPPLGVELCGDAEDSCRFAAARVEGDALIVADDGRPAVRIRYAWADSPVINLVDGRGLPTPGFELPIADR